MAPAARSFGNKYQQMKRIAFLLMIVLCTGHLAAAQSTIDKFFLKYQDHPDFTVINITPKMFSMFSKLSMDDPDAKKIVNVASRLKGMRILVKEDAKDGQRLFKEAVSFLGAGLEELMTVRDKEADVKFMVKEHPNGNIAELVMLVGSTSEFVALSIFGDISLSDLASIAGDMKIDGFENLGKLGKGSKGKK